MAPKRQSHLEEPPAVSSSSDEEEASSEEVSGSEDDEQESPKEETPPKVKKPRSKPSPTPTTRPSAKRSKKNDSTAENNGSVASEEDEEGKKSGGEDSKKQLFQRLWSEDDEIAILKGLIDYAAKKGTDPAVADMNAFHDFIKKSLHIDASKQQLSDKVRRLKKKYGNNLKKKYTPSKPHELEAFELSKKIWGREDPKSNGTAKSNKKGKSELVSSPVAPAEAQTVEIDRKACGSLSLSRMVAFDKGLPEHVVKKGLALIPESKKAELEAKWEKLNVAELDLFVKKSQLISEQAKLILEAIKSTDH